MISPKLSKHNRLTFLALLLFTFLSSISVADQTHKEEQKEQIYSEYPFSEIERIYDIVRDRNLELYFGSHPELKEKHFSELKDYISQAYPRDIFLSEMIRDKDLFNKARGNKNYYKENKEFDKAFGVTVNVSVDMAKIYCFNAISVYNREQVHPDFTYDLFKNAKNFQEKTYIVWIKKEVSRETFEEKTQKKYLVNPSDKIYFFSSPAYTWEEQFGRTGYLIVQGTQIKDVLITRKN